MLKGEVFRARLDEVDLPVHIALEIILTHVEFEDEGLSGLAGNEGGIHTLDRGDEPILLMIGATVSVDSGGDTDEGGLERGRLSRGRLRRRRGLPRCTVGNRLNVTILDARAFLHRLAEQKPVKSRWPAQSPAR